MKETVRIYPVHTSASGERTKGVGEVVTISKLTINEVKINYPKRLSAARRLPIDSLFQEIRATDKETTRDIRKASVAGGTILFEQTTKGASEALTGNKLFDVITNINPHALDGFHSFMQSYGAPLNIVAWGIGVGGLLLAGVIAKRRGDHCVDLANLFKEKRYSERGEQLGKPYQLFGKGKGGRIIGHFMKDGGVIKPYNPR